MRKEESIGMHNARPAEISRATDFGLRLRRRRKLARCSPPRLKAEQVLGVDVSSASIAQARHANYAERHIVP